MNDITRSIAQQELQECDQTYYAICRNMRKQSGYVVDWPLIDKAWDTCKKLHGNQHRKSGELYICHPRSVMEELARLRCKTSVLAAALLHDAVELAVSLGEIAHPLCDETAQIALSAAALALVKEHADRAEKTARKKDEDDRGDKGLKQGGA